MRTRKLVTASLVLVLLLPLATVTPTYPQGSESSFTMPEWLLGYSFQLVKVREGHRKGCKEYRYLSRELQNLFVRVCDMLREEFARPSPSWGNPLRTPYPTPNSLTINSFLEQIGAYYRNIPDRYRELPEWLCSNHKSCTETSFSVGKYLVVIETLGTAEPGHDNLWLPILLTATIYCLNELSAQCTQSVTIRMYGEPYIVHVPPAEESTAKETLMAGPGKSVEDQLPVYTLVGHTDGVASVAFSPDGVLLASSSWDRMIKLWEVATGKEVRTLISVDDAGGRFLVSSVAFSPSSRLLASDSRNRIKLWDVTTGQLLRTLAGHADLINSVAFSPDGRLLASGSRDDTIKLWEVATGQEVRTLSGHAGSVNSVAFSPDGRLLASGSSDTTIKLWEVATGSLVRTLSGHIYGVNSVAFSPDGQLLASGSSDQTLRLWNPVTGQELHVLISPGSGPESGHIESIESVAFSPDGRLVAGAVLCGKREEQSPHKCLQGAINLWEVTTNVTVHILKGHTSLVTSLAFNPDGRLLASGSVDNTIMLWDISSLTRHHAAKQQPETKAEATSFQIYPIYDYLLRGDIPIHVGLEYSFVKVQQLGKGFNVDNDGNIKLSYLDIYKILATGSREITIDAGQKRITVKMLFSIPKGEEPKFLKEATHAEITGFAGIEKDKDAWKGFIEMPTKPYQSLRLSWEVQNPQLEKFYRDLDESLKLLQFVYLLIDPSVKEFLETRIQEAKRSGRYSDTRAIYNEIRKVLETMGASPEVTIEIPHVRIDANYNLTAAQMKIPYSVDLFRDEKIKLWITMDNSDHFLDPGGVILHIQTNAFDLDKFSGIIKMLLETGSLGMDTAFDLISAATMLAADVPLDSLATLKDFGIWFLKSAVSLASVFLDYRADLAISIIQEREPASPPKDIEDLAEALRDQKDKYRFSEEINYLTFFDSIGQHFKLPPTKPIYKLLRFLSDDIPKLPSIYIGLHISEEIVKPLEYARLLTRISNRLKAEVDSTLDGQCAVWGDAIRFNLKRTGLNWSFDTGKIDRPEILLKVEGVSTADLISKMYGIGEAAGEAVADLTGLVAGKVVELLLPSFIDTSAKKVTEKIAAEIAVKAGSKVAEVLSSFIFGAVYNFTYESTVQALRDAIPKLPNIDLYILSSAAIVAVPSNMISNNRISLSPSFSKTIVFPPEPFNIGSCDISHKLDIKLNLQESGTEQRGNILWALVQNITGQDMDPPIFSGIKEASSGDGQITLSWKEAIDVTPPIAYKVYMATESGKQDFTAPVYVTNETSCTITRLRNWQSYYFVVRAEDSKGHQDGNMVEKAATPIPTHPFTEQLSWIVTLASHADLHLYDNKGRHVGKNYETGKVEEEIPLASFDIKPDGRQVITMSGLGAGHYRIELVGTSNGEYTLTSESYQGRQVVSTRSISSTIKQGEKKSGNAFAAVVQGHLLSLFVKSPLVTPNGLVAKPSNTSVSLSWHPYREAGFDLAGYNIYRRSPNETGYTKINDSLVRGTSYHDTELSNGITYYYVIAAVDTLGNETSYSRETSVIPAPTQGIQMGFLVVAVVGLIVIMLVILLVLRSRGWGW